MKAQVNFSPLRLFGVCFLLAIGLSIMPIASSEGAVPPLINYQGKLTTASGVCLNDTVSMTFSMYPDTSGSIVNWNERQTQVVVKDGIFNVLLGSVNPIPVSVFDGSIKYLGVKVESDPEMRPLKPMVSVAYAYRAGTVDSVSIDCSNCDSVFVNVIGPDSVVASSGTAFWGRAEGTSGSPMYGIKGTAGNTSLASAYGGYFSTNSWGTGYHYGVWGEAYGSYSSNSYGCYGYADNTFTGGAYGGYFHATSSGTGSHYGVMGSSYTNTSAPAHGCFGLVESFSTGDAYAGAFVASSSGTGTIYGVYARAHPDSGYAGYFQGDVRITDSLVVLGTKSAAVKVDDGEYRLLYCQESTENWFEDFGEGKLADGKAVIQIDPLFGQTVNTSVKYHVFLTPLDEPLTLAVANKTATSFEVIGPAGANISFSYRIVAKRKGYENLRLAKMGGPTPEEVAVKQARYQAEFEQERARIEQEREKEREEKEVTPVGR